MKVPANWIVPRQVARRSGVRGAALADLQLVCAVGPYEIDVLVRERDEAVQLEVVGQVTLGGRIYEPVSELALSLVAAPGADADSRTESDDFGEFDLESHDRRPAYGLRLGDREDAPCVLVWEGQE